MIAGPGDDLKLGPRAIYPAKAALTRARSALWLLGRRRSRGREGVRILFYHRVSDEPDELAVGTKDFARQMAFLADAGYRAVDVAGIASLLRGGQPPDGVIGLSFDDGYLDVVENACPVLDRHGFRASVYVSTEVTRGLARFSWYDRQPPLIPWEELLELDRRSPLTFEAHTLTHPNLLQLPDEGARREIHASRTELEKLLQRPVETFCYPAGLFGPRERAFVVGAGFHGAVSCEPGINDTRTDPFALRRIQVDHRDSLLDFRAKVGGGHDSPLPLRSLYRKVRYASGRGKPRAANARP